VYGSRESIESGRTAHCSLYLEAMWLEKSGIELRAKIPFWKRNVRVALRIEPCWSRRVAK
jgi:hypothetical protein